MSLILEVLLQHRCLQSQRCCCSRGVDLGGVAGTEVSLIWEVLLIKGVCDVGGVVAAKVSLRF